MTRRQQFLLGFAFFLLGLVALLVTGWAKASDWWVHGAWCGIGLAIIMPLLYRVLRPGLLPLLRNHYVVFTGAFAVYNLLGALLPVVGPRAAASYALSYYPIGPLDALRVDAANGIGFGTALMIGAISSGRLSEFATSAISRVTARVDPRRVAMLFMAFGIPATGFVLSVDLGLRDGPVAGVWRSISNLTLVAVFIAVTYRGRGDRPMMWIGLTVAFLESLTGLLLLSKMAVFLPLMVVLIGLSVRLRNRYLFPAGMVAVLAVFGSLGEVVTFGRASLAEGLDSEEAVQIRRAVVDEGIRRAASGDLRVSYHTWSRFYYTSAQSAAMDFYDQGDGGQSFALVPWLFIPRALAPNKPIITQEAKDFHTKITGRTGSSTGQGIFVSGFYNGGWVGLVIVAAICGWILAQTSAIARVVFDRRDALLLPLALVGVYMAFQISNHFLSSYFGPIVLIAYVLIVGLFASTVFRLRGKRLLA